MKQLDMFDNTYLVSNVDIEAAKSVAKNLGWKFTYRNRQGKQYITIDVVQTDKYYHVSNAIKARMLQCFPRIRHTSGGMTTHTFRINP